MDFDGVNNIICDAEESDWLDVSYSERNYVDEQPQSDKKRKRAKGGFRFTKPLKIIAAAVLCAALLAALLFVDGQFAKDVFETAKAAVASTLFDSPEQPVATAAIVIPSNLDLVNVTDGVATFNGGRAVLSFTSGKVVAVGEGALTVAMDDETELVYTDLADIYVAEGDEVSVNTLLAKYSGSFNVAVTVSGATVDVVGSETQLTWNV